MCTSNVSKHHRELSVAFLPALKRWSLLVDAQTEVQQLRAQMESAAKRAATDKQALEEQLADLKKQLEQLKTDSQQTAGDLQKASIEMRRLERDLEQAQARLSDSQEHLSATESQLQSVSASLHGLEQVKLEMERELEKGRHEVSELMETDLKNKGHIEHLNLQSQEKDQVITARDTRIHGLEAELHSVEVKLKMETERCSIELEGAQRRIASAEEERNLMDKLRQDAIAEKEVEKLRVKDEKELHFKTQGDLNQSLANLANTQDDLQERVRTVSRLQEEVLQLASDMRELQSRGEDRQREASEQQRLMQVANEKLAAHEKEVAELQTQVNEGLMRGAACICCASILARCRMGARTRVRVCEYAR